MNAKTITLSGLQIRYTESGQGSPVLLIHSLGASTVTWRDNIRPLAERHRVFAIDLPGHGDSDKPDISYDAPSMVNLIAEFVSALGLEKVALVGNSIGGGLCLLTALERPQIVSRLVLISSGGLGRNIGMFLRFASITWLGRILANRSRGSARTILPLVFYDKTFRHRRPHQRTRPRRHSARRGQRPPQNNRKLHQPLRSAKEIHLYQETQRTPDARHHILGRRRPHNPRPTRPPRSPLPAPRRPSHIRKLRTLAPHGARRRLQPPYPRIPLPPPGTLIRSRNPSMRDKGNRYPHTRGDNRLEKQAKWKYLGIVLGSGMLAVVLTVLGLLLQPFRCGRS